MDSKGKSGASQPVGVHDVVMSILQQLKKKDRDRFFWEPVEAELDLGDYYEVIKRPMDLGTIEVLSYLSGELHLLLTLGMIRKTCSKESTATNRLENLAHDLQLEPFPSRSGCCGRYSLDIHQCNALLQEQAGSCSHGITMVRHCPAEA